MPTFFTGVVTDTSGLPVPNIDVTFTGMVTNVGTAQFSVGRTSAVSFPATQISQTSRTDNNGRFEIYIRGNVQSPPTTTVVPALQFFQDGELIQTIENPSPTGTFSLPISPISPITGGTLNLSSSFISGQYKIANLTPAAKVQLDRAIINLQQFVNNFPSSYIIKIEAGESRIPNTDQEQFLEDFDPWNPVTTLTANPNYNRPSNNQNWSNSWYTVTSTSGLPLPGGTSGVARLNNTLPLASRRLISVERQIYADFTNNTAALPTPLPIPVIQLDTSISSNGLVSGSTEYNTAVKEKNSRFYRQEQYIKITASTTATNAIQCNRASGWKFTPNASSLFPAEAGFLPFNVASSRYPGGQNKINGSSAVGLIMSYSNKSWLGTDSNTVSQANSTGAYIQVASDIIPDRPFLMLNVAGDRSDISGARLGFTRSPADQNQSTDIYENTIQPYYTIQPLGKKNKEIDYENFPLDFSLPFDITVYSHMVWMNAEIYSLQNSLQGAKNSPHVRGMSQRICYLEKIEGDPESNLIQHYITGFNKYVTDNASSGMTPDKLLSDLPAWRDLIEYSKVINSLITNEANKIVIPTNSDGTRNIEGTVRNILTWQATNISYTSTSNPSETVIGREDIKNKLYVPIYEVRKGISTIDCTPYIGTIKPGQCLTIAAWNGSITNQSTWNFRTCPPII